jgi:hypothetical protein
MIKEHILSQLVGITYYMIFLKLKYRQATISQSFKRSLENKR